MKIIALDGASGTGKSVLIDRLDDYFSHIAGIQTGQVRKERLIDIELERQLDKYKHDATERDMRSQYCEALIHAYRDGYRKLVRLDADFQRTNGCQLIFLLDRYLLSLYAIQGQQWGITGLFDRCRDIRMPDKQFIIRLVGEERPEDRLFIDAEIEWERHGFDGHRSLPISNILSNDKIYNDTGLNAVRVAIEDYLLNL